MVETISGAGQHVSVENIHIPASKGPFTPGTKGYVTEAQLRTQHVAEGVLSERPQANSLNSVNWRMIVEQNPFEDGSGVGGENYANEVVALGWNLGTAVASPEVVGKVAIWDAWEYKFNNNGVYGAERHMQMLDSSGEHHRFFSYFVPHDGGLGSAFSQVVDSIVWSDWSENLRVNWNLKNSVCDIDLFAFRVSPNNHVGFQQKNTSGAFINLPFIDNADRLRFQNNPISNTPLTLPVYTVATLPSAAALGDGTRAHVSNALAPAFGAAVVGGGAVSVPVYSDGSTWKVG